MTASNDAGVLLERADVPGGSIGRRIEPGVEEHVRDAPDDDELAERALDRAAIGDVDLEWRGGRPVRTPMSKDATRIPRSTSPAGETARAGPSRRSRRRRGREVEERVGHAANAARFAFHKAVAELPHASVAPARVSTIGRAGITRPRGSAGQPGGRRTRGTRRR